MCISVSCGNALNSLRHLNIIHPGLTVSFHWEHATTEMVSVHSSKSFPFKTWISIMIFTVTVRQLPQVYSWIIANELGVIKTNNGKGEPVIHTPQRKGNLSILADTILSYLLLPLDHEILFLVCNRSMGVLADDWRCRPRFPLVMYWQDAHRWHWLRSRS